jgi:hypothetical protein
VVDIAGIRTKAEQCQQWAIEAGFVIHQPYLDLPPYHYGMVGTKPAG